MANNTFASRLALGTAQFGLPYGISNRDGQTSRAECASILDLARQAGIATLDTAAAYGNSESVLGELGVADLRVITKLPAVPEHCPSVSAWVETQLDDALSKLRISCLDGILLHRPAQLTAPYGQELFQALLEQQARGKAREIGISIYGPQELDTLPSHMRFGIVQAPLNILDTRLAKSGWVERLKDSETELHARSIFLQGLLLMSTSQRPGQFDRWRPIWRNWDDWLTATGLSALQACLRYALSLSWPDKLVIGVNSAAHLTEILIAARGDLPPLPTSLRCDDPDLLNPSRWKPI